MKPRELESPVVPDDIFKLAENNAILANCVQAWRHGAFSWEQAMMTAAAYLAQQNAALMESAVKTELYRLPRVGFVPSDEEAEAIKGTL